MTGQGTVDLLAVLLFYAYDKIKTVIGIRGGSTGIVLESLTAERDATWSTVTLDFLLTVMERASFLQLC